MHVPAGTCLDRDFCCKIVPSLTLGHYLHSISPYQGIVPLGTCTISLIVHTRRRHHPQRQSYHTYLRQVYRAATLFSWVQSGNQNCRWMYGKHNQLVLQEVIDSLTVIHTRVIAIIIVLGICVTITRLIGRTSPSNHIISKTWQRNGLFLKWKTLLCR